jgi:hypothetical protein
MNWEPECRRKLVQERSTWIVPTIRDRRRPWPGRRRHFLRGPFQRFALGAFAFLTLDVGQHVLIDQATGDFTQRQHGRLVVLVETISASAPLDDLARALGRHQHEFETVVDHLRGSLRR